MNEIAQITQAELESYKSLFNEKIGHFSLVFDKNEEGQESFQVYQGDSGTDATWSGHVILGNDYFVKWEFSILNGAYVEAKMKIDKENSRVVGNIYDFYEIWKMELSKYLVGGSGVEGADEMTMDGGEEVVSGAPAETSPLGETMPLAESRTIKGRQTTINSHSDRMKKLAGLL